MAITFIVEVIVLLTVLHFMFKHKISVVAIIGISFIIAFIVGYIVMYRGVGAVVTKSNLVALNSITKSDRGYGISLDEQKFFKEYINNNKKIQDEILTQALKDTVKTIIPALLLGCFLYRKKIIKNTESNSTTLKKDSVPIIKKQDHIEWYFAKNEEKKGPFSMEVATTLIKVGKVKKNTLTWAEGMEDWMPAGKTELSQYFRLKPPQLANTPSLSISSQLPHSSPKEPKNEAKLSQYKCLKCKISFESDNGYCVSCSTEEFVVSDTSTV